jgi:tRNA-specific 2-thiouridylase
MKRIAVAMSGGVDSSVAAARLQEQGHEVIGVTMQLWDGADAVTAARPVAEQLGIPFHAVDLQTAFSGQVVDSFVAEYFSGRTPNPCARCNKVIKFGQLLELSEQLGADYLATGHYVDLQWHAGYWQLAKGADRHKDQSYFLFALNQQQLARCLFPLGQMSKDQVRRHAAALHLSSADKAESQDICFIPDGDYSRFLEVYADTAGKAGDIVHISGQVLGHHQGYYRYTVGQRKGLGVSWTEPLYVVSIDAARQQVIVGEKEYLSRRSMLVDQCVWSIPEPINRLELNCRIRNRHKEAPAQLEPQGNQQVKVSFATPQQGITPGQAAVFYAADRIVGGGWIR